MGAAPSTKQWTRSKILVYHLITRAKIEVEITRDTTVGELKGNYIHQDWHSSRETKYN